MPAHWPEALQYSRRDKPMEIQETPASHSHKETFIPAKEARHYFELGMGGFICLLHREPEKLPLHVDESVFDFQNTQEAEHAIRNKQNRITGFYESAGGTALESLDADEFLFGLVLSKDDVSNFLPEWHERWWQQEDEAQQRAFFGSSMPVDCPQEDSELIEDPDEPMEDEPGSFCVCTEAAAPGACLSSSLAGLRAENERLKKEKSDLQKDLGAVQPAMKRMAGMEAENAALKEECDRLREELATAKNDGSKLCAVRSYQNTLYICLNLLNLWPITCHTASDLLRAADKSALDWDRKLLGHQTLSKVVKEVDAGVFDGVKALYLANVRASAAKTLLRMEQIESGVSAGMRL